MKFLQDSVPGQIEQSVEDKIAASHENKMTKMIETNEANSTRLIDQLVAYAKSKGGNHSSENRTFSDTNMGGTDNIFYSDNVFRYRHALYIDNWLIAL